MPCAWGVVDPQPTPARADTASGGRPTLDVQAMYGCHCTWRQQEARREVQREHDPEGRDALKRAHPRPRSWSLAAASMCYLNASGIGGRACPASLTEGCAGEAPSGSSFWTEPSGGGSGLKVIEPQSRGPGSCRRSGPAVAQRADPASVSRPCWAQSRLPSVRTSSWIVHAHDAEGVPHAHRDRLQFPRRCMAVDRGAKIELGQCTPLSDRARFKRRSNDGPPDHIRSDNGSELEYERSSRPRSARQDRRLDPLYRARVTLGFLTDTTRASTQSSGDAQILNARRSSIHLKEAKVLIEPWPASAAIPSGRIARSDTDRRPQTPFPVQLPPRLQWRQPTLMMGYGWPHQRFQGNPRQTLLKRSDH